MKKGKKFGNHSFSQVEVAKAPRSRFNRSSTHKTTFDANNLIPVFIDEVLPGDTFEMQQTNFCRLATPIKPSMDNLYMDTHYFFVPSRLVWENWERFMGAQDNPDDSIDYIIPTRSVTFDDYDDYENTIYDYMGIPFVNAASFDVNELPFRAYNLIFNEWFRDQNLQDSVEVNKSDSASDDDFTLLRRGKRHDYFTSALPFPQKGEPVGLSLSGDAPISGRYDTVDNAGANPSFIRKSGSSQNLVIDANVASYQNGLFADGLVAELDGVTSVTINQLRQAFQLQKFLERDARSGTRYIEIIKSHFRS